MQYFSKDLPLKSEPDVSVAPSTFEAHISILNIPQQKMVKGRLRFY